MLNLFLTFLFSYSPVQGITMKCREVAPCLLFCQVAFFITGKILFDLNQPVCTEHPLLLCRMDGQCDKEMTVKSFKPISDLLNNSKFVKLLSFFFSPIQQLIAI